MKDTVIYNVFTVDGTGSAGRVQNVLIRNGLIVAVGSDVRRAMASSSLDGCGLVLAPGFIDVHSHSDISILAAPEALGKISQGITSEIVGNCGLSLFPVTDLNREHLQDIYSKYNIEISWDTLAGYIKAITMVAPAINIASHCGHNTLRAAVNGYCDTPLDRDALSRMHRLLDDALNSGAAGLSSGFLYTPGKFAERSELTKTLSCLAGTVKPYITHLRNEGDLLEEALSEAIDLCRTASVGHLHVSHLKTSGCDNWYKLDSVFEIIADAQSKGLKLSSDRYPYIESMTNLSVILPPPYDDMDDISITKKLQNTTECEQLVSALTPVSDEKWRAIRLVSTPFYDVQELLGSNIFSIARELSLLPALLCVELLRCDSSATLAAFRGMSQDNLDRIIGSEFVCCGSDESARPLDFSIGRSHPRGFGSFPCFINHLKESVGLERAVARVTSYPASLFGLKNRGLIAPGYAADLVLFDPSKLKGVATFSSPHSLAEGICKVWVNGTVGYDAEQGVLQRNGNFLKVN